MCSSGYGINSTRTCGLSCPDNSFADDTLKLCVNICSNYPLILYGDPSTNKCVTQCPTSKIKYYSDLSTQMCV